MKRFISTPTDPSADPICEGFIIRVKSANMKPIDAAAEAVEKVLPEPKKWYIYPFSETSEEFEVRKKDKNQEIPVSLAWDLSRKIEKQPNVLISEPMITTPGISPDPSQIYTNDEMERYGMNQKSFLFKEKPLDCAKDKYEWNLETCSVRNAWDLGIPYLGMEKNYGQDIRIGHPDTGFTYHPEIWDKKRPRILEKEGEDFEDYDSSIPTIPLDKSVDKKPSHGTGTASVIMSTIGRMDEKHVTGVAPEAELVPIRVDTDVIHWACANLKHAIYHAIAKKCHVISMSLGGPLGWWYLHSAIIAAAKAGLILIAAAGNGWPFGVVYPANFPEVIAVAASSCKDKIWRFSSTGKNVDITAPGESVWRAKTYKDKNGSIIFDVDSSSGTSYATAMTAGACALWLAYHGREKLIGIYDEFNLAKVFKYILTKYGVDKPDKWEESKKWGKGILNVEKLLKTKLPKKSEIPGIEDAKSSEEYFIRSEIDDLKDFFPDIDTAGAETSITHLLYSDAGKKSADISGSGLKKELLFHIVTDPSVRAAITKEVHSKGTEKAARPLKNNVKFMKNASESLKCYLFEK
jgi:serine protease